MCQVISISLGQKKRIDLMVRMQRPFVHSRPAFLPFKASTSPRPEVNLTNILCAAFTCADHKSAKNTFRAQSFLRFWDLHGKSWL